MLNQCILVGRVQKLVIDEKKSNYIINLDVTRSVKNSNGVYETDLIKCQLFKGLLASGLDYLTNNSLVGIKGRIQIIDNIQTIVAEKIIYLSSGKEKD